MKIEVARFQSAKIPRIAQLIQRSNQFNLTTHRYSELECERLMKDEDGHVALYAGLSDRFGDHGLIGVVVLKKKADELEITDWLMSCRVLSRGVEQYLMSYAVRCALDFGASRIRGEYIPTAKNAMVKEFFAQFGFEKISEEDGCTVWHLDPKSYKPAEVYITEVAIQTTA